ncbi:G-protein coupled receptor 54-like isoform X2 [Ptychodera flava]
MTVDRYYVVSQPLRSRHERTPKVAVIISVLIWIGSFLLHVPIATYFKQMDVECNGEETVMCFEDFPNLSVSKVYQAYSLIVMYLLPLSVIGVCYGFILKQIWKVEALGKSDGGLYDVKQSMNRRRKVTRMVLIVVLLFAISWGPLQIMNSWLRFDPNFPIALQYFREFCLCLAYSNSCVNPFVYAFTGNTFRKYFKRLFRISDESSRIARFHTMHTTTIMRQNSKKNNEKTQETSI